MAFTDFYGDLETFKARASVTKADADAVLTQVLTEASRQIDRWTGRNFNKSDPGIIRYYQALGPGPLYVDDLVSVSELVTDDGQRTYPYTWLLTDYDLSPFDAPAIGNPYTHIDPVPYGQYHFSYAPRGVRITGVWGWPEVPDDIAGATYIQATRLWKRKDAPFGIAGSADLGQLRLMTDMDPDVKSMISPYRRMASF